MSLRSRSKIPNVDEDWIQATEGLAYTLLETVRLRCERLDSGCRRGGALQDIHADVGLAGYYVSADFDSETRGDCLMIARHESSVANNDDRSAVLAMMREEVQAAADAIVSIVPRTSLEHIRCAQLYVMSARELLGRESRGRESRGR